MGASNLDLNQLLVENRNRLHRMIQLRLDRRLQGRVDASDVIQDAFMEATERQQEYENGSNLPPFLWLRLITAQRLMRIHRQHLGVKARDPRREISLYRGAMPAATSAALAAQLIGKQTSPSQAVIKAEIKVKLQEALNQLEELDREVLALRHTEQLSNNEVSVVLGLSESAASKRYIRALQKLREVAETTPGLARSGVFQGK